MAATTLATGTLLECGTTEQAVARVVELVRAEAGRFNRLGMTGTAGRLHRLADELEDVATRPTEGE